MILPDVNVLVYAHRKDTPRHAEYHAWLQAVVSGPAAFGLADLVLSGFVRVVTHPKVFKVPTPVDEAIAFANAVRECENRVRIAPGVRHWSIFVDLCSHAQARGNLVADAYLAALAIEAGAEWVTTDRDFTRFPKLKMRHPLD